MGTSESKDLEQTENGAVNANFIVKEQTLDVGVMLAIIVALLVLQFVLKLYKMHRGQLKRNVRRNIAASMASMNQV